MTEATRPSTARAAGTPPRIDIACCGGACSAPPAAARAENSYRLYGDDDVHRLRFIRLCRAMDMSLDEVRSLLALDVHSEEDGHAACATLDGHLSHVRTRLDELRVLESELLSLRGRCNGQGAQCRVIEALHERADAQPAPPPVPASRRHV